MAPSSALPPEVAEKIGPYYVYLLVDPRDGSVFYVGKGSKLRLLEHGVEADLKKDSGPGQNKKLARINEIRAADLDPLIDVVRWGLDEPTALFVESVLIDCLDGLTNLVSGHASGRTTLQELVVEFGAEDLVASDPPALLVRLGQTWKADPEFIEKDHERSGHGWYPGITPEELANSTRAWWKIDVKNVTTMGIEHAVAVVAGVTRAVYEITNWLPPREDKRRAFQVEPITDGPIYDAYVGQLGKRIWFPKYNQSPIRYWPFKS